MNQGIASTVSSPDTSIPVYPPLRLALLVWGLGILFYCLGFYQRVAPAVMTAELMAAFGVTAAGLGNLSAAYYYCYVAMQIPTGILVDFWGPRRVLAGGGVMAAMGTFVFSLSTTLFWANIGRALIGGAVAVGFVAALKLAVHWFSPRVFATTTGVALFCGVLGAMTAGVPLRIQIDEFGWRSSIFAAGVLHLLLAGATWMLVRDDPSAKGHKSYSSLPSSLPRPNRSYPAFQGIRQVLRFRNTWLLTLAPGGLVGSILSFAGLWGVPFLEVRFDLSAVSAAAVCSLMMVCWAAGGTILGRISDRTGRKKTLYLLCCLFGTASWAVMIFWPGLALSAFIGLSALAGFATGGMTIGFAFIKESFPPSLEGTVMGVYNTGMMVGTPILQPLIGWTLDLTWTGGTAEGIRIYTLASYQAGFSVMLLWCVLSCFFIGFSREKERR